MQSWTPDELAAIGAAEELRIATRRPDGTLRNPIPIWQAVVGDAVYIRSAHGPQNGWFRHAVAAGAGRVSSGGVEKDVTFELAPASIRESLDAVLRRKYSHYPPSYVGAITGDDVLETTLKVMPAE